MGAAAIRPGSVAAAPRRDPPVALAGAEVAEAREAAGALEGVIPLDLGVSPVLGGEDFAYYQEHVPGAFLFLGNQNEEKGIIHFCHHPRFMVDDEAMGHGVRTWLGLALGVSPDA